MSCRATPAHASEPLECNGSRFSASEQRHSKAKPRFCLNAVKRESSKKRGGAAENCFILLLTVKWRSVKTKKGALKSAFAK